MARAKAICEEWGNLLEFTDDTDTLLDMYLKGIDFCLSNDYPSNDYIRRKFKGKMEHKGIHLDEAIQVVNEKKVVCLGSTNGTVEVNGYSISELFLKHQSNIELRAKDNCFCMVDLFDGSYLKVIASEKSKVCVNIYGGQVDIEKHDQAMVRIVKKDKKTY